jgi:DNA polymerase-4
MRDDSSLSSLPLAVGGGADRRGVVATCNYKAREFGIHSAMPTARALRLCPSLVVIPPDFNKYRSVSHQIREIFQAVTDLVEPLSLDEAFLDVSNVTDYSGSATLMAENIRQRVKSEVGIIVSAGVAPNKFLAKIASDWNKPDGLFVVTPDQVDDFVERLPVGKLFGVGKVTEKKINALGVSTCGELRSVSLADLSDHFGVMGQRLYELCRGIDDREVRTDRRRKSLSVETTFVTDLPNLDSCLLQLDELVDKLLSRYEKLDIEKQRLRYFLKMRFDDFTITTIERQFDSELSLSIYQTLCREAWQRRSRPVRLLGIGVRFAHARADLGQQELFDQ